MTSETTALSDLFAAADEAMFLLAGDGSILYLTPAGERMVGGAPGTAFPALFAAARRAALEAMIGLLAKDGGAGQRSLELALEREPRRMCLRCSSARWQDQPAVMVFVREAQMKPDLVTPAQRSALTRSEHMYRALFDSSFFVITVSDAENGRFLEVNEAFERSARISRENAIGKSSEELGIIPAGAQQDFLDLLHARGGTTNVVLVPHLSGNGTAAASLICSSIVEVDGTPLVFSIACNVTEYHRAQEDLRETDTKFRALFNNMRDAMFFIDRDGRFMEVNQATSQQLGYPREVLLSQPAVSALGGRFAQLVERVQAEGQLSVELEQVREDGTQFPLELTLVTIDYRGTTAVAGIGRDLSERAADKRALEESLERFRVLFSAAPDAAFIFDLEGQLLDCNLSAERLLGRPRAEVLGACASSFGLLASDALRERVQSLQGAASEPELLALKRTGSEPIDVELRMTPIALDGQQVIFASVRDVSARMRSERAQRRLEEQLHQAAKMDAVGRLAGGIAHDFNNMLTAIAGYAELLLYDEAPGSPRAPGLNEILGAARSAASLTSQLLAFSRKQMIEPVVLDLNELLERSTRMLERLIGEDVALSFTPGQGPLRVKMDPNQLQQVLINLAVNARDAMPKGGRLRVRTEATHVPEAERAGDFVLLTVQDEGTGMSEETLGRMFEPFFTTKERSRGTGLGLSIIYGIVKQNGGAIVVSSRVGEGSKFEISLPRVHEEQAPASPSQLPARAPRGQGRVLLVEDEDAVRAVTTRFLEHAGFRVTAVGRGSDAIALARARGRFDLLVTDVVLPEQNGRKVYEALREILPTLRVLYISGYDDDVIARAGVLDPEIHFLAKPFTQEQLVRKIEDVLR